MKACPIKTQTDCTPEGLGSGVTVVVTQDGEDPGGWILDLYMLTKDKAASRAFVGTTTLGVPNTTTRRPTRVVMMASCPAAYRFQVIVTAPPPALTQPTKPIQVGVFCGDASANALTVGT